MSDEELKRAIDAGTWNQIRELHQGFWFPESGFTWDDVEALRTLQTDYTEAYCGLTPGERATFGGIADRIAGLLSPRDVVPPKGWLA